MLINDVEVGDAVTYIPDDPEKRPITYPKGIERGKWYKVLDKYWEGTVGLVTYFTIKVASGAMVDIPSKNIQIYKRNKI